MYSKLIKTGCIPLDQLLNGGIETSAITQIYGESGSGKTNLCLQISIELIKNCLKKAEIIFDLFIEKIQKDKNIDYYQKITLAALDLNININKINIANYIKLRTQFKFNS